MGAAIPQEPRRYRCLLGTVSTAANQRRAGGLRDRHLECPSRVPRVVAVCGLAVVEKDDLDTTGISAPGRQSRAVDSSLHKLPHGRGLRCPGYSRHLGWLSRTANGVGQS